MTKRQQDEVQEWAKERAQTLAEDGASDALIAGYLACAMGFAPVATESGIAGDPFAESDFHEGFGLAEYDGLGLLVVELEVA